MIVEDEYNNLELVVGGSGGSQILTATLNVILNSLDFGMNLFDAVKSPRIHHQLIPNEVQYETNYNQNILNSLRSRGHKVTFFHTPTSLFSNVFIVK